MVSSHHLSHRLFSAVRSLAVAAACLVVWAAAAQPLVLDRSVDLPSVHGRLDHMDIDLEGNRLFAAALGADSVEVVDLAAGKRVARLRPLHEPQGVAWDAGRLFVANGARGNVQVFADAKAPSVASAAELADADNLRVDAAAGHLYVGYGHALAILDLRTLQLIKKVDLPGHPEAFQLESNSGRMYVNVPNAGLIAVVDRVGGKVTASWAVVGASRNFPMALDEPDHRLFVATRQPALLLVYDTATGRRVAELAICGDADDLFFDVQRRQLYAVCGEGVVDVVRQRDPDRYELSARVPTSSGARTGLYVPQRSTLFIAVPSRGAAPAEIRAYRIP
jgi:hypothetical protein